MNARDAQPINSNKLRPHSHADNVTNGIAILFVPSIVMVTSSYPLFQKQNLNLLKVKIFTNITAQFQTLILIFHNIEINKYCNLCILLVQNLRNVQELLTMTVYPPTCWARLTKGRRQQCLSFRQHNLLLHGCSWGILLRNQWFSLRQN